MNPFITFLNRSGLIYKVQRNGIVIAEIKGLPNREKDTMRDYVGFLPDKDIQVGDWLINPANQKFYVEDIYSASFTGKIIELKAFVLSEAKYKTLKSNDNNISINNLFGNIIGNQSNISINYNIQIESIRNYINESNSDDKEELKILIDLLEKIVNNETQPSKGMFSKFSQLMEKHSWLTGSIASVILNWLVSLKWICLI